jgi:hypothetical protein
VFGNRVLRGIFGGKTEEVAGRWRILHNEELHSLYPSPDIIIVILICSIHCIETCYKYYKKFWEEQIAYIP